MIAGPRRVKTRTVTVQRNSSPDLAEHFAALTRWWHDAGVEWDFVDTPVDWLPKPEAKAEAPAAIQRQPVPETVPASRIGGDRQSWPSKLAEFGTWWLTEPSLDTGGHKRLLPSGSARAPLMVVVAQPEAEDRRHLLEGAAGRLLDAILAALGHRRDGIYLASALPRCTPAPDWAELGRQGTGEVLAHHVALAEPQRVLVFGRAEVGQLMGDREGEWFGTVPLLLAPLLDTLLARPKLKRPLWERLLAWSE